MSYTSNRPHCAKCSLGALRVLCIICPCHLLYKISYLKVSARLYIKKFQSICKKTVLKLTFLWRKRGRTPILRSNFVRYYNVKLPVDISVQFNNHTVCNKVRIGWQYFWKKINVSVRLFEFGEYFLVHNRGITLSTLLPTLHDSGFQPI